ncbi:Allantoate amidohydrolase [compost metagenome]
MVSGAGHDAQLFAPLCSTAMIFVPSQGGISHSPEEFTSPEELAAGLGVLIDLLYKLGYEEKDEMGAMSQ